jgi:hypothetical protein
MVTCPTISSQSDTLQVKSPFLKNPPHSGIN